MKTMTKLASVAILATLVLGSQTSFAQGGVEIVGSNVRNTTLVNRANNLALGRDAKAVQSIGTLHEGTRIRGSNVRNTTLVNRANNLALGRDATACQSVGNIGSDPNC